MFSSPRVLRDDHPGARAGDHEDQPEHDDDDGERAARRLRPVRPRAPRWSGPSQRARVGRRFAVGHVGLLWQVGRGPPPSQRGPRRDKIIRALTPRSSSAASGRAGRSARGSPSAAGAPRSARRPAAGPRPACRRARSAPSATPGTVVAVSTIWPTASGSRSAERVLGRRLHLQRRRAVDAGRPARGPRPGVSAVLSPAARCRSVGPAASILSWTASCSRGVQGRRVHRRRDGDQLLVGVQQVGPRLRPRGTRSSGVAVAEPFGPGLSSPYGTSPELIARGSPSAGSPQPAERDQPHSTRAASGRSPVRAVTSTACLLRDLGRLDDQRAAAARTARRRPAGRVQPTLPPERVRRLGHQAQARARCPAGTRANRPGRTARRSGPRSAERDAGALVVHGHQRVLAGPLDRDGAQPAAVQVGVVEQVEQGAAQLVLVDPDDERLGRQARRRRAVAGLQRVPDEVAEVDVAELPGSPRRRPAGRARAGPRASAGTGRARWRPGRVPAASGRAARRGDAAAPPRW